MNELHARAMTTISKASGNMDEYRKTHSGIAFSIACAIGICAKAYVTDGQDDAEFDLGCAVASLENDMERIAEY